MGLVHLGLAVLFAAGLTLDHRVVLGLNPWLKPLKFALSITVYVWTVAWLLGDVRAGAPRAAAAISRGVALAMVAEIACIALQSLRGVPSHFNASSAFDGAVFGLMGLMILVNTLLAAALLLAHLGAPPSLPRTYRWAVRAGLVLFLLGSGVGGLMVSRGAHAVGVADGGPGLPLVNWSTEGGDLRVAHALGLHALQVLPLAAFGLARVRGLHERTQLAAVSAMAVVGLLVFVFALAQALAGRPLAPL